MDHEANRTVFHGFTFAICSATSRIAAEPEPLSLIPGPSITESKMSPTMTADGRGLARGLCQYVGRVDTDHREVDRSIALTRAYP